MKIEPRWLLFVGATMLAYNAAGHFLCAWAEVVQHPAELLHTVIPYVWTNLPVPWFDVFWTLWCGTGLVLVTMAFYLKQRDLYADTRRLF